MRLAIITVSWDVSHMIHAPAPLLAPNKPPLLAVLLPKRPLVDDSPVPPAVDALSENPNPTIKICYLLFICYKGACSISFDFRLWLHIVLLANLQVQGVLLPDILGHQAVDFVPQQEGIVDIPACLPSTCTFTSRSNAVLDFTTDLIVRASVWKDCAARRSL